MKVMANSINAVVFGLILLVRVVMAVVLFLIVPAILGWMFDQALWSLFNKNVPFIVDMIVGVVLGPFTVVGWLLSLFW